LRLVPRQTGGKLHGVVVEADIFMTSDGSRQLSTGVSVLAETLVGLRADGASQILGLTGSVASGKTTLARLLAESLSPELSVETVSTDGFLFPNAVLQERDLMMRKGFPETYDRAAMSAVLTDLRGGAATFPAYSHETYDVDPAMARTIPRPDILILEGLGFSAPGKPDRAQGEPDILIYLDAPLEDIETWFLERFLRFWNAARTDPSSFYAQFLHMTEPELVTFAKSVWQGINLPNLTEHILPLRDEADIVVSKDAFHVIRITEDRVS
tara:strand:+ start:1220 stop:2026 length:807 start_codon:yes stop_codon:yes gene_type:complete